jgi:hypothetical protein
MAPAPDAQPGHQAPASSAHVALGWHLLFAALALASVFPLFYVRYPPLEDLPQHLAAVRILHDFHDPQLGFARFFELDLLRTQYLAYYLTADLLAYLMSVELAVKLLTAASLVATPYAAAGLLRALGKDPRLALLVLPLTYNAHLILGFFNFLLAIPVAFYGVTLAIRQRRSPSRARAFGLAALALVCFYAHVVPFALMALGIGLVGLSLRWRTTARALLPLLPATVSAVGWLRATPAGQATLTAAAGADQGPKPQFMSAAAALHETPRWLTDVLQEGQGLRVLQAWGALCVACVVLALLERVLRRTEHAPDALAAQLGLRLSLLAPLCALLYFVAPSSYDWIWPIAQRFPLLCALWLVIALPRFRLGKHAVLALAVVLAAASFHVTGKAFAAFEREEVDASGLEHALAAIPRGRSVVGLIFDRGSRYVAFSPFLHFVAYYQARRGGAVMFSFADFPQSPFRFRQDNHPPRVPPRWEWMPERVHPRTDLGFYDYALVRSGPGSIALPSSGFVPIYRGQRWSAWRHAQR